jgi:hypothetical protein
MVTYIPNIPQIRLDPLGGQDWSTYGLTGGTPGPRGVSFFDFISGTPREITPGGFVGTRQTTNYPSDLTQEFQEPGMADYLGLAGGYLANKAGLLAGGAAQRGADFGPSLMTGLEQTPGVVGGELRDLGNTVGDWFGQPELFSSTPVNSFGAGTVAPLTDLAPLPELSWAGPNSAVQTPQLQGVALDYPGAGAYESGLFQQPSLNYDIPADSLSGGLSGEGSGLYGSAPVNVASGPNLASFGSEGFSFANNMRFGGLQSGLFSGGLTFGMGLLQGQSFGEAAKSGADTGIGTALGFALTGGNPIGAVVGGFIGGLFRIICTELNKQGLLSRKALRHEELYTLRSINPLVVRGYHIWSPAYVRLMQKSTKFSLFTQWWAGARAEEILYKCGQRSKPHYGGKLVRLIIEPPCFVIGCAAWALNLKQLDWCGAR